MAVKKQKRRRKRTNIFFTYFVLFACIFLVTFGALGFSLIAMVNNYELKQKTDLLTENTASISKSVATTLSISDMNSNYTPDKELICETLETVSNCIDASVFVCDPVGTVIMCPEKAGISAYQTMSTVCKRHAHAKIDDSLIQQVYEGSTVSRTVINGNGYYVVGTPIKSDNEIIGCVFALTPSGTTEFVSSVMRVFFVVSLLCLALAFVCIWILTKHMVTPLQQMSAAAKRFAIGDFSYRVRIDSDDELSDLGNAFNDMANALDKLESSRRSFVANVSHELKTPMTSIAGFIDGILDGTIPKEKEEYYLKIVRDEVRRLSRLVVAMLNMSKMESGDFEMKPKNYNISDQIIHILLTFEQKIEKKNIEVRGLENLEPCYITADTDMIYQVIYNLFDNAVKFTNDGGYISVTVDDLADYIQVSIKNSGSGIDSHELSRIFERFYKVDKSRSLDAKGAGLGLYIVKMMVEMHGGRIYARSDSKTEAEFVFTLPKSNN